MLRFLLATLIALAASPGHAQDSAEYAQMAKATWSAFECASLAAKLEKPADQQRLFEFGYDQGKTFIAALQAGKVKQEHLSSTAPIGLLLLLQGPSPDFMLGRIYESAQDNALSDIYRIGDYFRDKEEQSLAASNKYASSNCQLIGNGR